jgi:formylglycine-generating enzyme required for sulfatase activity
MDMWGTCAVCDADLNRDGAVDRLDLGLLFQSWGPCPVGNPNATPFRQVPVMADSGERVGSGTRERAIYSEVVSSPDAGWLRVIFDPAVTTLEDSNDGDGAAFLRITSLHDGFEQILNATTLAEWGFTSAYFNGDAVRVELVASEGGTGRVAVLGAHAGMAMDGGVATICGPTDDRCQSSDPRVGRIMPVGCTAWLFDNQQNAMLSAGHCVPGFNYAAPEVVQFQVPKSSQDGTVQHPSPSDQYAIDPASVQFRGNGDGDDWAHFGVFSNSTTGLSPFAAQGMRSFVRASANSSGLVRITGFGVDDGWENQTNQTHVGMTSGAGPGPVVSYVVDTTGGNSGSPIIRESDGAAIGIHTNGECTASGDANFGVTFANADLLQAIANPQGIAAAKPPSDLNGDGQVDAIDVALLLGSWGEPCTQSQCGDLNGDGTIGAADLALQLGAWPPSPNPPSVPTWATLIEAAPDPAIVTDANLRNAIIATGLAWRVRDNASQIEMLLVPPGTFNMGCSSSNQWNCTYNENPVHAVTLTCPFYIGRYEVTQAQWTASMGNNPSFFQGPDYPNAANRPVEQVSWNTIQGFLSTTGLRLPTEAEWEYAYRAGTATAFHSGPGFPNGMNDEELVGSIAWFSGNNGPCCSGLTFGSKAVGQKAANALGLHDMSGNVWEWVNDWYSSSYYASSPAVNPPGPATGIFRVLRGGSWDYVSANLRSSTRNVLTPGHSGDHFGFRVARVP